MTAHPYFKPMEVPMPHHTSRHPLRVIACASIFVIFSLALAACGGTSNTPSSQVTQTPRIQSGGNISVGLNADVVTLDPLKSSALVDRQVMLNLYDTLVKVDAQNAIV